MNIKTYFIILGLSFLTFSHSLALASTSSSSGYVLDFGELSDRAQVASSDNFVMYSHIVPIETISTGPTVTIESAYIYTETEETSVCGNGVIESGEDCDTNQFQGKSCSTFGYPLGTLSCSNTCHINTTGCYEKGTGGGGGQIVHFECFNSMCISVVGRGENQCHTNQDCLQNTNQNTTLRPSANTNTQENTNINAILSPVLENNQNNNQSTTQIIPPTHDIKEWETQHNCNLHSSSELKANCMCFFDDRMCLAPYIYLLTTNPFQGNNNWFILVIVIILITITWIIYYWFFIKKEKKEQEEKKKKRKSLIIQKKRHGKK